ncbi:hypothetical protein ATKI12_2395 [Kitasatospora sp. Ki12]
MVPPGGGRPRHPDGAVRAKPAADPVLRRDKGLPDKGSR